MDYFASFLHHCEIVLILPSLKVEELIISVNLDESIVDLGLAFGS